MTQALREAGQRVTPQRLAVLKILAGSSEHPSVEKIYEQVAREFPTTSLATVYKTLTMLKSLNQVLELGFAHWGSRYDGKTPHPHPHAVCLRCGAIADPDMPPAEDMAREMARRSGYRIDAHQLDFFGLCPRCQKKA
ncbi:MAG: transcriptional repressor [Proteobacteria bacterium]|nr:transcriptional repressor [Pseudomonadota bacterium]MBU1451365.1 transcriptional repressor [Pseudomonadota bacterium]MBU2467608.1 transcriptional repressor [Pseudomonadota bacterium]MBU2517104.1 transcriptional repressor [Pseudomonadota bacterium]